LDKQYYIEKINSILKDVTTYSTIKKNPVKNIETNLNNIFKRWLSQSYISKHEFLLLRSSDCPLPKAYDLLKIH